MLFNSYAFIFLFLPITLIGYFWLTHKRLIIGSKLWLVGASLFFYSYWNIYYLPLLLLSIFVNFFVGSAISDATKREKNTLSRKNLFKYFSSKQLLIFGILFDVSLLGYFKYTDFFLTNFNGIFHSNIPLSHIVLPLGISFFTFTQIAFLVDAYKEKIKEHDFLNYMLFVSYFPHLLAGPILHHSEMMPQFASRWNWAIRWRYVASGLFLFSIGLFKKVWIADFFAEYVNQFYTHTATLNILEAWATSLTYTLQLYFDFSGYTDMAIGMSLIFNIKLPINFNSPYKAKDIQDFWRRWHITLSRFLRDYIYIPLGGNKVSKFRNYTNLFTVFLVGGLWHGASWMFVIWGALHGVAIILHRAWKELGFNMWSWLGWFITFNFVNIAWVFFRAPKLEDAVNVVSKMFQFSKFKIEYFDGDIYWQTILGMVLVLAFKNSTQMMENFKPDKKTAWFMAILFAYSILSLNKVSEFIYFNF
jgi:D-alanyl-lipoteichoic acid acyltransferase DltB (MBOAT superfamily)